VKFKEEKLKFSKPTKTQTQIPKYLVKFLCIKYTNIGFDDSDLDSSVFNTSVDEDCFPTVREQAVFIIGEQKAANKLIR